MRGIGKSFPGVRALCDVSLTLYAGEVLGLVGENGAGKSTLMKILAGAQSADAGSILIDGREVKIPTPRAAEQLGVGMIYQEFNLVPQLNAAQNIALGFEPVHGGFIDERAIDVRARRVFDELGIEMSLTMPTSRLSISQQQVVEIAKALSRKARIIVMDEPTAALSENEIERLFAIITKLKTAGTGIIYISHRMDELPRIADRVTVLRDGQTIETRATADFPPAAIVEAMVGRPLDAHYPQLPPIAADAPVVLAVQGLHRDGIVNGVDLEVHAGEIVGLAGLVGAGRSEIVRGIAGADVIDGGMMHIDGRLARIRTPAQGIRAGIAFITEDRKAQGLVLGMTVRENTTLAHLQQFVDRDLLINRKRESAAAEGMIEELHIRTPSLEQHVRNLSGGNQQKVVLAKWLLGKARVFLFDEPTRGIDIAAKAEIYNLMIELLKNGAAIVMVSSDLPEVLGMSHRVLVVRSGRIVRSFARSEATPAAVIAAATGVTG